MTPHYQLVKHSLEAGRWTLPPAPRRRKLMEPDQTAILITVCPHDLLWPMSLSDMMTRAAQEISESSELQKKIDARRAAGGVIRGSTLSASYLNLGDNNLRSLLRVPGSPGDVESIDLGGNELTHACGPALSDVLTRFALADSLDFRDNNLAVTRDTPMFLSCTNLFSTITTLSLHHCSLKDAGVRLLADALASFTISNINPPTVEESARSSRTSATLDTAVAVPSTAAATRRPVVALTSLDLSDNHLTGAGLLALAAVLPAVPSIEVLSVEFNGFSEEAISVFAEVLPLTRVRELAIGDSGLTLLALRRLAAVPLRRLGVAVSATGPETLRALLTAPNPAVRAAFPHLPSPLATSVEELDVGNTKLTDAGVAAAVASLPPGALPRLRWLSLATNELTSAAVQPLKALASVAPLCRFVELDVQPLFADPAAMATVAAEFGFEIDDATDEDDEDQETDGDRDDDPAVAVTTADCDRQGSKPPLHASVESRFHDPIGRSFELPKAPKQQPVVRPPGSKLRRPFARFGKHEELAITASQWRPSVGVVLLAVVTGGSYFLARRKLMGHP